MNLRLAVALFVSTIFNVANATPVTIGFDATIVRDQTSASSAYDQYLGTVVHGRIVIDPRGEPTRHFVLDGSEYLLAVNRSGCAKFVNEICTERYYPAPTPTIQSVSLTTVFGSVSLNQTTPYSYASEIRHFKPVDPSVYPSSWGASFAASSGGTVIDGVGNMSTVSNIFDLSLFGSTEYAPGVFGGYGNIFDDFYNLSEVVDLNKVQWMKGSERIYRLAHFFFEGQCNRTAPGTAYCSDPTQSSRTYFDGELTKLYLVPEPSTSALLFLGAAFLARQRRKRFAAS